MGKTSRTSKTHHSAHTSKHCHNHLHAHDHASHSKLNAMKKTQTKKKRRRNARLSNNLRKVLQNYQDSAQSSAQPSETTLVSVGVPERKHKQTPSTSPQPKRRRHSYDDDCTSIVIEDDSLINDQACSSHRTRDAAHINCSTPNAKHIPSFRDISKINNDTSKINNDTRKNNNDTRKTNNDALSIQKFNEEVADLTKEINRDSYLTIDLTQSFNTTTDTVFDQRGNTVIELDDTLDNADCTVVSVSNANLSISGESDITVLNISRNKKDRQMRNFAKNIATMNASDKGKLLELITENIFSGCNVTNKRSKKSLASPEVPKDSAENTYIKEVIVGQSKSRNSIGSNIYNPEKDKNNQSGLRLVVIDGSNVAMQHGRGKVFSVKGLKICIDYFLRRGHVVKAFVPRFRCKFGKSSDPRLLDELERKGVVVYTPSREIQGRMVTSYDDRYIVQCAAEFDGVIVSGDNYRDLLEENQRWRFVIENRLLPFTWVDDMLMFPKDPLGRSGPTLEHFLRHPVSKPIPATNISPQ